jgi:uncharacterized membrane protein
MQAITKSVAVWMIVFAAVIGLMSVLSTTAVFAQCDDPTSIEAGVNCAGDAFGEDKSDLNTVVQTVINTMLFVIGILSVIMLIVGGIRYVVSGGNQSSVEAARNTILYAIVGLVIAFVSWGVVNFVVQSLID